MFSIQATRWEEDSKFYSVSKSGNYIPVNFRFHRYILLSNGDFQNLVQRRFCKTKTFKTKEGAERWIDRFFNSKFRSNFLFEVKPC